MKLPAEERPEVREVREVVESLRITEADVLRMEEVLQAHVTQANARCAMVIGEDGRRIAQVGNAHVPVERLAAGWFEIARVMRVTFGREGIAQVQGSGLAVEVTMIAEQTALATVVDRTAWGQVRSLELAARAKIRALLDEIAERRSEAEAISRDFRDRGGPPTPPLAIA
jgi:hypothetical protein